MLAGFIPSGFALKWDWHLDKNECIKYGDDIFFHPDTLIEFVQHIFGSEQALSVAKQILRERVDIIFGWTPPFKFAKEVTFIDDFYKPNLWFKYGYNRSGIAMCWENYGYA